MLRGSDGCLERGRLLEKRGGLLQGSLLLRAIRLSGVKIGGDEVTSWLDLLQVHLNRSLVRLSLLELLSLLQQLLLLLCEGLLEVCQASLQLRLLSLEIRHAIF